MSLLQVKNGNCIHCKWDALCCIVFQNISRLPVFLFFRYHVFTESTGFRHIADLCSFNAVFLNVESCLQLDMVYDV